MSSKRTPQEKLEISQFVLDSKLFLVKSSFMMVSVLSLFLYINVVIYYNKVIADISVFIYISIVMITIGIFSYLGYSSINSLKRSINILGDVFDTADSSKQAIKKEIKPNSNIKYILYRAINIGLMVIGIYLFFQDASLYNYGFGFCFLMFGIYYNLKFLKITPPAFMTCFNSLNFYMKNLIELMVMLGYGVFILNLFNMIINNEYRFDSLFLALMSIYMGVVLYGYMCLKKQGLLEDKSILNKEK